MVWTYCPECGSDKIHHHEGIHKQCVCGQEWFSDMDYTDVVRTHLSGAYSDKDAEIARLTAALAEAEARCAALVAGAYEAAAEVAAYEADFVPVKPNDFRKAIRALIPEIATAALDQIKAEAEAQGYARGLEDAAGVARRLGGKSMRFCEDAIRALAQKEAGE